ncbi:MAG: acetyl-CoA carboxylase biotin carboxyl carrier protein [Pseudomonadota bacterium]
MAGKKDEEKQSGGSDASTAATDAELIREIASILTATNLAEIEIEREEFRIRVSRGSTVAAPAVAAAPVAAAPVAAVAPAAAPEAAAPAAEAAPAAAVESKADHPGVVKSPMVGTAYQSPSPGTPAFVKVGDRVAKGQTIMIVEAMKTMNPIPSPRDGTVQEILASDSQPVEYGEPLMIIV